MVTEPPIVKFSMIHRYVTDGNREAFEAVHSEYFHRMQCFFSAYLITGDDKYIEPLADILWNICDLESWSIPAHVKENLSIAERRRNLDLCSTIAGCSLAELIYFIGDKLPELVVKRVNAEIRYRIIDSYKDATDKRYWWLKAENNWSAVCIASVLGTYIYAATDEEIKEQLPRMIESAECYLRGFADDGCCQEGYAYWNYGFSYFCIFAEYLREYTDGKINMFEYEKVKNIAKFQERITLNENQCLSFSDATIEFNPIAWLSHFLKGVYPELHIPKIEPCAPSGPTLRQILWQNPDMYESSLNATEPVSFEFTDAQWFIYRGGNIALGCKAGHNDEQHNHNDVGSFIISKDGKVSFCDPGVGQYTRQYFSPERYELMLCSSRGHSVPIINGELQKHVPDKSTVTVREAHRYAFNMEKVYKLDTLRRLERDFECLDNAIKVTDTYEFDTIPTSVVERFVSLLPIEMRDNAIYCGTSVLEFDCDRYEVSFGSEVVERKGGKVGTVYYVDLTVKCPEKNMTLEFLFK